MPSLVSVAKGKIVRWDMDFWRFLAASFACASDMWCDTGPRLLRGRGDQVLRRGRYHGYAAQAADFERESGRPLWQARLRLCCSRGCLSLSRRRAADLSFCRRRRWQDNPALLDRRLQELRAESTVYDGT